MSTIDALCSIRDDQYWKVQTDPHGKRFLECVDKPDFICTISQTLEFAEVMEIAREALKKEKPGRDKLKTAGEKLSERYTHLVGRQFILGKIITSFFLWWMGFVGENSLESMGNEQLGFFIADRSISDEELKTLSEQRPHLTGIDLSGCKGISGAGLKTLAENCPLLTSVNLSGCTQISDKGLKVIAERCPLLTEINLSRCGEGITGKGLKTLAERCDRLSSFNLSFCKQIKDEDLIALAKACIQLTDIDLFECKISDRSLEAFASHCPHLTDIRLFECNNISNEGLKNLAKRCSRLSSIRLSLPSLTIETLNTFAQHCPEFANINLFRCDLISDGELRDLIGRYPRIQISGRGVL